MLTSNYHYCFIINLILLMYNFHKSPHLPHLTAAGSSEVKLTDEILFTGPCEHLSKTISPLIE